MGENFLKYLEAFEATSKAYSANETYKIHQLRSVLNGEVRDTPEANFQRRHSLEKILSPGLRLCFLGVFTVIIKFHFRFAKFLKDVKMAT